LPAQANYELADVAPADGQLSLEEIKQHHRDHVHAQAMNAWATFDLIRMADTDGDGAITLEEYKKASVAFDFHPRRDLILSRRWSAVALK
jgi:hypothetical protein